MQKIAATLALATSAMVAPQLAAATPHTLFEFRVASSTCADGSADCPGQFVVDWLNGMRVGIAKGRTSASLTVTTYTYSATDYITDEWINFGVVLGRLYETFNVNAQRERCESYHLCQLYMGFTIGEAITGSFSFFGSTDTIEMASDANGLWSGYLTSDNGPTTEDRFPLFTGSWVEVPEPSPVALIGAGLAGLIWVRRRKDTRQLD